MTDWEVVLQRRVDDRRAFRWEYAALDRYHRAVANGGWPASFQAGLMMAALQGSVIRMARGVTAALRAR